MGDAGDFLSKVVGSARRPFPAVGSSLAARKELIPVRPGRPEQSKIILRTAKRCTSGYNFDSFPVQIDRLPRREGALKTLLAILILGHALSVCCVPTAWADGPEDNNPLTVRKVPPLGIEVDASRKAGLLERCARIRRRSLEADCSDAVRCHFLVFPRAVEMTLDTQMIYAENDLSSADMLLEMAERRLDALGENSDAASVLQETSNGPLVVGGFRSKIDSSVQPYGLVLPQDWQSHSGKFRLDVWLHGRGERSSEVAFLAQRSKQVGEYAPPETIVLHPYGRYSNAFKFAGEIDVLEAIEHVCQIYDIDRSRIAVRGFSMGGAGCWQLAVHYPNLWAAANPGAGFSETTQFLQFFQGEVFQPTEYQRKLLQWYDCPPWTNNLRNVPTIAYSGELDRQKQAADIMVGAFESRGMTLPHVIGPNTAHKIHPESKVEIQAFLDQSLAVGKAQLPKTIDFTTYSLRYHRLRWLSVERLQHHWTEARVQGELLDAAKDHDVHLETQNVTAFSIALPDIYFQPHQVVHLHCDGQALQAKANSQGGLSASFGRAADGVWKAKTDEQPSAGAPTLCKRPGLQGPIDDAFMDAFVFVGPDQPLSDSVADRWIASEFKHAKQEWKSHFRGDIREVAGDVISPHDIASNNLIVFGTPTNNTLLAKVIQQLPIAWEDGSLTLGDQMGKNEPGSRESFDANHVPILIYPNPLNPARYIVLNSGFTYREFAYLNNARQIPMLPDWAIVDVADGTTTQFPGKVVRAGFFDEQWQLQTGN